MTLDISNLELKNNGDVYGLKQVLSKEELYELRKEHSNDYVVVKIGNKLYTNFVHINGGTNFEGKPSICIDCKKFYNCPKVLDREFIIGAFNKSKYDKLMRLEKYPFIRVGVETYGRFFVWKCKAFEKEPLKEKIEDNKIENLYPYLKKIRLEKEKEEEELAKKEQEKKEKLRNEVLERTKAEFKKRYLKF